MLCNYVISSISAKQQLTRDPQTSLLVVTKISLKVCASNLQIHTLNGIGFEHVQAQLGV